MTDSENCGKTPIGKMQRKIMVDLDTVPSRLEYTPTLVDGFEITETGDGIDKYSVEPGRKVRKSRGGGASDSTVAPPDVSELSELQARSFSMTTEMAGKLGFQVAELSGSRSTSVSVLEWSKHKDVRQEDSSIFRWGCAMRFCVTVNKLQGDGNMNVPFLAAEAQLGQIQAEWTMQLRGITGSKISGLLLTPSALDVETYVVAKQALEQIKNLIDDQATILKPMFLHRLEERSDHDQQREAALRTFIFYGVAQGRSKAFIAKRLPTSSEAILDGVLSSIGVTGEEISDEARKQAIHVVSELDFCDVNRSRWSWL